MNLSIIYLLYGKNINFPGDLLYHYIYHIASMSKEFEVGNAS